MVERGVVGYAQQPGAERRIAPEAVETMERTQERVLADVLRVFGADDPARDTDDDRTVPVDQLLERGQVAPRGAAHKLGVAMFLRRG